MSYDPVKQREYSKKYRETHREYVRELNKKWVDNNRERANENASRSHRESLKKHRGDLISLLGGKCRICGFSDSRALVLFRIGIAGKTDKGSTLGSSVAFYKKTSELVLAGEHPVDLLCANCVAIKRWIPDDYMSVPTKKEKEFKYTTQSKLSAEQVVLLREDYDNGMNGVDLGKKYGVSDHTARQCGQRKTYKWIK